MPDTKLSALPQGLSPDTLYGIEGGVSKKYFSNQILNVKDYGAKGDGTTDDRAAIQSCFDAAFGPWSTPHGISGMQLNKPICFPPGNYRVTSPTATKTVSSAANNGSGLARLTLNNTTGLANGDIVYVRSSGMTFYGSFTIKDVDATHLTLNISFSSTFTGTVRAPCLRIKDVQGGKLFGSGKGSTTIFTPDPDCALISTNGWGYCHTSDISFSSEARGIAFDLNGDGLGTVQSQSSLFTNCQFAGSSSVNGDIACAVGMGQFMGSEITFHDCYVGVGTIAGISWHNFNALSGRVIGGNFSIGGNPSSNVKGIWVQAGACPIIHGVGFQCKDGVDIWIDNSADDAYCITGCRTESDNFVRGPGVFDFTTFIGGCSQTTDTTTTGYFYFGGGSVTIEGSSSNGPNKYVNGQNAEVVIKSSRFIPTNYWFGAGSPNYRYLEISPPPLKAQTGTSYTLMSHDGGCKTIFTNSSPVSVTVPKNSDGTNRLATGSKYFVQQGGAGKVTFAGASGVTLNSRAGLKSLNGQWACATLTCDGTDLWSLEGDIIA